MMIHSGKITKTNIVKLINLLAWIYVICHSTCFIRSNLVDNIVQLGLLAGMFFFAAWSHRTIYLDKVSICFIVLACTAIIGDAVNGTPSGLLMAVSYILPLLMYVVVKTVNTDKRSTGYLYSVPVIFGVCVSAWSVLGAVLRIAGVAIGSSKEYIDKFGNYVEISNYGFGIFATWGSIAGRSLYRLNSYFIEPSKFAMFLLIPFFFLLEKYREKKHKRTVLALMVIISGLISTMSRAGLVSLIGALVLSAIMRRKKRASQIYVRRANNRDFIRLCFSGGMIVTFAVLLIIGMVTLSKVFPNLEVLSVGITNAQGKATLIRQETVDSSFILNQIGNNLFGSGYGSILELNKETNLANALILWSVIGGIPAIITLVILFSILITEYYIPGINSSNYIQRGASSAFIGLTLHSLSYGTWMTPDYLLLAAIMAALHTIELKRHEEGRLE